MVKAVVFDMDGMLIFEDERFSKKFSREHRVKPKDVSEFFEKEFDHCLEGRKDLKSEVEPYLKKWGVSMSSDELLDYWFSISIIDSDIADVIRSVKRKNRLKIVLCTNNEKHRVSYLEKKFDFKSMFDFVLRADHVGAQKPERRVYERLLKEIALPAGEIAFFDDSKDHVKAAKEVGMKAFLFKDKAQLVAELRSLGIDV